MTSALSRLIASVTLARATTSLQELAWLELFTGHLNFPVSVELAGHPMSWLSAHPSPKHGRLRAVVHSEQTGEQAHVSVDALRFPAHTPGEVLIWAYRSWLGEPEPDELETARIEALMPRGELTAQAKELAKHVSSLLRALGKLNREDLESWLGDDDEPNKRYWPRDVFAFHEHMDTLETLITQLSQLQETGAHDLLITPLEALLKGIEAYRFEDFFPAVLQWQMATCVELWASTASALKLDDEVCLSRLAHWIELFELWHNLEDITRAVPESWNVASWMSQQLASGECEGAWWVVRSLLKMRVAQERVELFLEEVPLHTLAYTAVITISKSFRKKSEAAQALGVIEDWLATKEGPYIGGLEEITEERRRQMKRRGDAPSALLQEMWRDFDTSPSTKLLKALRKASEEMQEEVDTRALNAVNDPTRWSIAFAAEGAASDTFAAHIVAQDIEALSASSSYTLEDAAKKLKKRWPAAAVLTYAALGVRHVARGKAKYYDMSVSAFRQARALFMELDQAKHWEVLFEQVCSEHGRKHSFMPSFRELAP